MHFEFDKKVWEEQLKQFEEVPPLHVLHVESHKIHSLFYAYFYDGQVETGIPLLIKYPIFGYKHISKLRQF